MDPDLLRGSLFRVEPVLRWWFDFAPTEESGNAARSPLAGQLVQVLYEPIGEARGVEVWRDRHGVERRDEKSGLWAGAIEVKPKRQFHYVERVTTGSSLKALRSARLIQAAFDRLRGEAQGELQRAFASRQDVGLVELGKMRAAQGDGAGEGIARAGELWAVLVAMSEHADAYARRLVETPLHAALPVGAVEALEVLVAQAELRLGRYCMEFEQAPGAKEAMASRRAA